MKKLYFMAVAAIAALSSCTSDNELELNQNTGKEALTFTATMEDSEATRATYDNTNQYALWEAGDQISINGKSYTAQEGAGATATFKATTEGEEAEGDTYNAYFPADLYDGTTATLPAIQTYTAGKFNMPMYATSSSTELAFKNLCAVLAIKVTSADITTLKSIKVASDQKMNGTFTVSDNKAVINDDKGTNVVVLESSEALTLTADGTTFYIAIPAQTYKYLNIFLSADGETYTQAMATKKATGLGTIARSKMFNIDYAKNATKLWEGNLFVADYNIGATSATEYGCYYTWGGFEEELDIDASERACNSGTETLTGDNDTATKLWGSNWRLPTNAEYQTLLDDCTCEWTEDYNNTGVDGLLCQGKEAYIGNSIFFPCSGYYYDAQELLAKDSQVHYWTSMPSSSTPSSTTMASCLRINSPEWNLSPRVGEYIRKRSSSVRAVLEEAASPAPAAPATKGTAKATIGGEETDVNWVQLWENGPKFAEYNVGVTDGKAESYGGYYTWAENIASTEWGSAWRMPTQAEFEALLAYCDVEDFKYLEDEEEITLGIKYTGKGDYSSNSIFLPAAGYYSDGDSHGKGSGHYWSSTPDEIADTKAYYLLFYSEDFMHMLGGSRFEGKSVRAVLAE